MSTTHIMAVMFAIAANEFADAAKQVGTASNQYLLGGLVVALICIVWYRERQQNKQHTESQKAQKEAAEKSEKAIKIAEEKYAAVIDAASRERTELYERMERQNKDMNEERRQRWTMMLDAFRENTIAFRGVRETLDSLKQFMTEAERERKELLRDLKPGTL